ncbi:AAA family ATPase [Ensifer adhaerens]|uniref:AAA family ATPase n=1 Tax=Ensifer adhaerens TaxID=106592 RepID=UPI001C4E264A|nr:MoxR family ATPase [Ensifer adhaerens]MBW0365836.1 MoxR family ATPase [Ensifer adhaerens]UCM20259.1 MoxR family ATPase [Ensifer adhaerens]
MTTPLDAANETAKSDVAAPADGAILNETAGNGVKTGIKNGEIIKIDEKFFTSRKGPFPDVRGMRRTKPEYADHYHSIENWEGIRRWKTEDELKQVRAQYYGDDQQERRYLWLPALDHHRKLSGAIVSEAMTPDEKYDVLDDFRRFYHSARKHISGELHGDNIIEAFDALFIGLMFGRHVYIEGSSGIGKTDVARRLCSILSLPYQQYDAYADATDLSLLGGEVPVTENGVIRFTFERGPCLTPGLLGLVIDELPRLPASTSNVLLQAMAERKVNVSLVASGRGSATVLLSPHFIVIGTGNPVGYGGQGERSFALFDRFDIGIEMKHPDIEARREIMYQEGKPTPSKEFDVEPSFTLNGINALVREVSFSTLFVPIMVTAAHALGPRDFLARTNTENPADLTNGKPAGPSGGERVMWEAARLFARKHKNEVGKLSQMVEENLTEGSNPRGEISVIQNAKALSLVAHQAVGGWKTPEVYLSDLGRAYHWANYARLKTYPGAEGKRGALLDMARDLFFNAEKWLSVVSDLEPSSDRSTAIDELTRLGMRPKNAAD